MATDDTALTDAQKASLVGLATAIRTKMYGKDVREAIASAIEMVGAPGVNSYFTPKGVKANLAALKTAYPAGTDGIWITQDDGYWNFWGGTAWEKGNTYQGKILPDNSVGIGKLDFNPVNVSFVSKNLFNKNDVISGSYIKWNDGTVNTASSSKYFCATDQYIKIVPLTAYSQKGFSQIAFYDSNKTYISGIDLPSTNFVSPREAYYFKGTLQLSSLDTAILNEGSSLIDYEPWGNLVDENSLEKNFRCKIDSVDEKTYLTSKNICASASLTSGSYIKWNDGSVGTNSSFTCTDFVPIDSSQTYTSIFRNQIAFFDADKNYISGLQADENYVSKFTAPDNAEYARFTIYNDYLYFFKVEKAEFPTIDGDLPAISKKPQKTVSDMLQKLFSSNTSSKKVNVKLIGDSRTAGVGGTGYATDGEIIYGENKVNTSGTCWANLLKSYLESKFNCEVKNFGVSGKTTRDFVTNIGSVISDTDDIVLCDLGTNDRWSTNDISINEEFLNLLKIYKTAIDNGAQIIFMSSFPATDESSGVDFKLEDVDINLKKVSMFLNQEYISIYEEIQKYIVFSGLNWDDFLGDGLHPNDKGYTLLYEIISTKLGIPFESFKNSASTSSAESTSAS